MNIFTEKKGFTLIETLVAIAILSILVVAVASYLSILKRGEQRNRTVQEVTTEAADVIYVIGQTTRSASSISQPATSTASTSLTLVIPNIPTESPTQYYLSAGKVYVKKGAAAAVVITSDKVNVTSLTFTNLSAATTKGTIRAAITVTNTTPNSNAYLNATTTLYSTITIR